MTTHDLRAISGESQKEFAEHYHIPVATVRNWDSRGSMPEYVHYIIDLLQKTDEKLFETLVLMGDLPLVTEYEIAKNEVTVDGEWWDKYSEAPDLYRDPYMEGDD